MSTTTCPHCGRQIELTKANTRSTALAMWHQRQTFESAVPAIAQAHPAPQFSEAERRAPARAASVESDVLVPATQALITGAVSLIPGIALTIWLEMPWYSPFLIAGGVIALFWLYLLDAHRKLLWSVETIINRDIDGDGAKGNPKPARVEVAVKAHRHTELDDLPGPVDALREFAQDVYSGRVTFSERGARKSGYGATAFKELRTTFINRGWATWNVPGEARQGVKLTAKGRAVMHGLSEVE